LQAQIGEEREARAHAEAKVLQIQTENVDLTAKINTLMEDLTNRLRAKDAEVNQRLREVRELVDQKNSIEMDRNEIQVESIALKEENRTLKDRIKGLQEQLASASAAVAASSPASAPPLQPAGFRTLGRQATSTAMQVSITEEMVFNEGETMKDLTKGIQELIGASEESNPGKILTAMKAVVMTVRRHLDDAEEYEKYKGQSLTPEQREKFNNLQGEISDKLTALVMVAKAHASGKADGSQAEVVGKIESLSTNLSNVVVRLLGGMMQKPPSKAKEVEIPDDFPAFLDQQTNVIVQAIQALLLVIKNPATAVGDYVAAIDSLVGAVTHLRQVSFGVARGPELETARVNLSDGISKLLSIRETVNSGGPKPPSQVIASSAFELAKLTKEIVTILK